MAGIKSMINMNALRQVFEDFAEKQESKTLQALIYQGEDFVNNARSNDSYTDRTGNLRSSIGYIILKDGKVVRENFQESEKANSRTSKSGKVKQVVKSLISEVERSLGLRRAKQYANEIAALYPRGWVLIGVAGMNYAAAVESRGFDVITEAANSIDLKQFFNEVGV